MPRPFLKLITAPAETPIDLSDVKSHLRIDSADEDAVLTSYLATAVEMLDGPNGATGRAIMLQTWEQRQERTTWAVELVVPAYAALVEIRYLDQDLAEQTATLADFTVTEYPDGFATVSPKPGKSWPAMASRADALRVQYTAGEANAANVPEPIKSAIRLLVGHFEKEREATSAARLREIPIGVDRLIEPYKAKWVA